MLPRVGSRRQGEKVLDVLLIRARMNRARSRVANIGRVSPFADETDNVLHGVHGLVGDDACAIGAVDQH